MYHLNNFTRFYFQIPLREDSAVFFRRIEREYPPATKLRQKMEDETVPNKTRMAAFEVYEELRTTVAIAHIHFKELGILKFSRSELFSITDLISTFDFWSELSESNEFGHPICNFKPRTKMTETFELAAFKRQFSFT